MNHSNDNNDSKFGKAIDCVVRAFETRWHKDRSFAIEHFLDSIDQLVNPFGIDGKKPEYRDGILAELIHLEMDLRCAHGYPFEPDEYLSRFADHPIAVEDALERVRRLYPHCFRGSVLRTTKTRIGDESQSEGSFWIFEAAGHPEVPTELGPYREITYIGSGGFGDVYKAIDSRCDEAVALKFPRHRPNSSTDGMEHVKAEAEMAMRLNHSGIVSTRAIENIGTYAFIVQDFVDGMDLKKFMERPDLEQRDVGLLVALIADALAYAHREGIIHRDIKPQNILIDKNGKPYVADFGLAIHSNQRYETIGQPVCGTKYYFSPEVVSGRMYQVGGFYDVWSLGIVFYQLLTGKRPFGGPNDKILFEEIAQKDPEPPHVMNHRVDPELDRLCLHCLEKKPGRRMSARKLADGLQGWLKQPTAKKRTDSTTTSRPPKFVPRGLHSYTTKDAPFFLRLLPGPRDEHGIPASIRFWRDRILEPVAQEDRVPVGVIYGPSGCGKSSYVKAGLIPLLDHQVKCLYVESTHADTDVRLLRALRHEFDIPSDASSLPEIFAGLRDGKWQKESRKKVLICLDQFEQRLSSVGEFDPTELINALRYCDGENLQCLLLVRDDFLMSMSRFADALDMDLREGQNTQIVDLFDRKHARKILTLLGHAYDRLSSDNVDELAKEEIAFVNRAVDDQVEDQHVICVRLTVFAEMFKNQPWSVANLQEAGSAAGVGVQFLDRELGPQNKKVPHLATFRLLCSLLPAAGTDIRGAMKSEAELAVAAGLPIDSPAFKKVNLLLDNDLRLITRTDPDVSGVVEVDRDNSKTGDRHFQLTHDYLVPSIRAWQDKWLGDTRRGRAELRLQRLASEVMPGKPPENLPTHLEWLSWKVLLRRHRFSDNERVVMQSARRRFFKDASLAATILIVVGGLISWVLITQNRNAYADDLVQRVKGLSYRELPGVVAELADYKRLVLPKLQELLNTGTEEIKRRARLGLLVFDTDYTPQIVLDITREDSSPSEVTAAVAIANRFNADIRQPLRNILGKADEDPQVRFRALCALAGLNVLDDNNNTYTGMAIDALFREPAVYVDSWLFMLRPFGNRFFLKSLEVFQSTNDESRAKVLARMLYYFDSNPESTNILADLLPTSNTQQFSAIFAVAEEFRKKELLKGALGKQDTTGLAEGINVAVAQFRCGDLDPLVSIFSGNFESIETTLAINLAGTQRLLSSQLRTAYDSLHIRSSRSKNLRRAYLQVLALHADDVNDSSLQRWLVEVASDHAVKDVDACCFSTSELILRKLDQKLDKTRQERSEKFYDAIGDEVFIDKTLRAYSIFDIPGEDGISRKLAVSTTESTNKEMAELNMIQPVGPDKHYLPYEIQQKEYQKICQYCNKLSYIAGLKNELCYLETGSFVDYATTGSDSTRLGYRLPTVSEWESAIAPNTTIDRLIQNAKPLVEFESLAGFPLEWNYFWIYTNCNAKSQKVGQKLPDANGLFDCIGNVQELCEQRVEGELQLYNNGGTARDTMDILSKAENRKRQASLTLPFRFNEGFRVIRWLD